MDIITPMIIVGAIGLLAGIVLAVASIVMAVPKDERAEALEAILPGANCGACGYSGCPGYAAAMAKGEAQPGLCSPGGTAVAAKCGEILGSGAVDMERRAAFVHCMGSDDHTVQKMDYDGINGCTAASLLNGGTSSCRFGCLGLGDCAAVCDYGAIQVCNGVAIIDEDKCVACGKCVAACPKGLIKLASVRPMAVVRCSSCDKGRDVMQSCKVGCIGCMKCQKTCEAGAITVANALATVDPQKCTGCGKCADACPRHIITMLGAHG